MPADDINPPVPSPTAARAQAATCTTYGIQSMTTTSDSADPPRLLLRDSDGLLTVTQIEIL